MKLLSLIPSLFLFISGQPPLTDPDNHSKVTTTTNNKQETVSIQQQQQQQQLPPPRRLKLQKQKRQTQTQHQLHDHYVPVRKLEPPFPDGLNGGRIVTIPPEDTYAIDVHLAGNSVVLPPRPIQVWLPQEYDLPSLDENYEFPILICHDGQNAMQDASSWTGVSWRMMGALCRLSERDMLRYPTPPVVVLLPSAQQDLVPYVVRRRHLEYSSADVTNPFATAHVEFVAQTVLPYVHTHFDKVSREAKDTFVIGSSLGGQASMNLLLGYPNLFGGAACLSPAFQPSTMVAAAAAAASLDQKRIYMDIGGDMNDVKVSWFDVFDHMTSDHWWNPGYFWLDTQLQPSVDAMSWALKQAGIAHSYKKFPGGRHNERAWSLRIHQPLLYLLGKQQQQKQQQP